MPADRRRRLIEVAAAEFASTGYAQASLNRIISRCEISKSSFYYFIDSKAELFDWVTRELVDETSRELSIPDPEEFNGPQFWTALEDFFVEFIRYSQQHPEFRTLGRMFYSDPPESARATVAATMAATESWAHRTLCVGRRCGAVRDDLPEALQYSLAFAVVQVFDEWTLHRYEEYSPAALRTLTDHQFAAIRRLLEP